MSADRSTARLDRDVRRAWDAGESIILSGNTTDIVVAEDGSPRALRYHLASLADNQGAVTILCLQAGTKQLTLPNHQPVPFRQSDGDADVATMISEVFAEAQRSTTPLLFVFDYADLILPAQSTGREQNRALELIAEFAIASDRVKDGHRLAIVAKTTAVDERLGRLPGFASIDVELPDLGERTALIERAIRPVHGEPLGLAGGLTASALANLSGGLQLNDLAAGRIEAQRGHPIGREWVQRQKVAALRRAVGDLLRVYPPGQGLSEVAGLPQLRRVAREALATGRAPRRLLLCGPPGVGKTLCVTSVADELGMAATALGPIRSMWVGESERNLRRVTDVVTALEPVVLHIDEIDQALGQRQTGQSADGGTSERMMAVMMTFLGSNTDTRVTVIGTSNRPDLLDPAMFDRFTIIPVLHPTPPEAAQILAIAARRDGRTLNVADAEQVVRDHGGLITGRVLVDVLDRAITFADADGIHDRTDRAHLEAAFADLLMAVDPLEHERLALLAISMSTFKSYLPWEAARHLGLPVELPPYVKPLLDHTGGIADDRVRARLRELAGR